MRGTQQDRETGEGASGRTRPFDRPADIQAYYRDPTVVSEYIERRTAQPLNGLLHRRQVSFINAALRERLPHDVLEIAPGPARLTAELDFTGPIIAIDGSWEMLLLAQQRLRSRVAPWQLARGDAFSLPVADHCVDLAFAIRFIRRFPDDMRCKLYQEVRRVLRPGGALILDAQNRAIALPHRERKGLDRYKVYDALYDRGELIAELENAGFSVRRIEGIIGHFAWQSRINRLRRRGLAPLASWLIELLEHVPSSEPSTWMVLAEVRA